MTQEDQINDINNKKQVQDNEEVVEENKTVAIKPTTKFFINLYIIFN